MQNQVPQHEEAGQFQLRRPLGEPSCVNKVDRANAVQTVSKRQGCVKQELVQLVVGAEEHPYRLIDLSRRIFRNNLVKVRKQFRQVIDNRDGRRRNCLVKWLAVQIAQKIFELLGVADCFPSKEKLHKLFECPGGQIQIVNFVEQIAQAPSFTLLLDRSRQKSLDKSVIEWYRIFYKPMPKGRWSTGALCFCG